MSFYSVEEILTRKVQNDGFSGVLKYINQWKDYSVFVPYKITDTKFTTPKYYILVDKNNVERNTTIEEFNEMEQDKFYLLQLGEEKLIKSIELKITNFTSSTEIYKYNGTSSYILSYEKFIQNKHSKEKDILFSKTINLSSNNFEKQFIDFIKDWKYTNYNIQSIPLENECWYMTITLENNQMISISGNKDTPNEYIHIKSLFNRFLDINNFVNP